MLNMIIAFLAPFIIRQIDKYGHEIDWAKVKSDAEIRIRVLVPGKFFDAPAVDLANRVIDAAAGLMQNDEEMKKIVEMCKQGRYLEAIKELAAFLLSQMV